MKLFIKPHIEPEFSFKLKSKTLQSHPTDLIIEFNNAAAAGGRSSSWLGILIKANFFINYLFINEKNKE